MRLVKWQAVGLRVNYAGVSEFTDSERGAFDKESRPCFPAQKPKPKTSEYLAQVVAEISEPCAGKRKNVLDLRMFKDGRKVEKSRASAVVAGTTMLRTCACRTVTTLATRTRIGTTIMGSARPALLVKSGKQRCHSEPVRPKNLNTGFFTSFRMTREKALRM